MPASETLERKIRPRWDSGRPRLAWGLSAGFHSLVLMGFLIYHAFPPRTPSTVPVFEMVSLEPPKLRPLRPKTLKPPPTPPKIETRQPDAPKLTSRPKKTLAAPKPPPKAVQEEPDTTKPVQATPETAEMTTTIVSNVPSDPRLSFWASRVKKLVERLWNPPAGINVQGSVKTVVAFQVARDGTISGVTVSQGSGNATLDELAQQTLERLGQAPPIPENFPTDPLQVSYEFVYKGQ